MQACQGTLMGYDRSGSDTVIWTTGLEPVCESGIFGSTTVSVGTQLEAKKIDKDISSDKKSAEFKFAETKIGCEVVTGECSSNLGTLYTDPTTIVSSKCSHNQTNAKPCFLYEPEKLNMKVKIICEESQEDYYPTPAHENAPECIGGILYSTAEGAFAQVSKPMTYPESSFVHVGSIGISANLEYTIRMIANTVNRMITDYRSQIRDLQYSLDMRKNACAARITYRSGTYAARPGIGVIAGRMTAKLNEYELFPIINGSTIYVRYVNAKGDSQDGFLHSTSRIVSEIPCGNHAEQVGLTINNTHGVFIGNGTITVTDAYLVEADQIKLTLIGDGFIKKRSEERVHVLPKHELPPAFSHLTGKNWFGSIIQNLLTFDFYLWIGLAGLTIIASLCYLAYYIKKARSFTSTGRFPSLIS